MDDYQRAARVNNSLDDIISNAEKLVKHLAYLQIHADNLMDNLYTGSMQEKLDYDAQNYPDQMELPLDDE